MSEIKSRSVADFGGMQSPQDGPRLLNVTAPGSIEEYTYGEDFFGHSGSVAQTMDVGGTQKILAIPKATKGKTATPRFTPQRPSHSPVRVGSITDSKASHSLNRSKYSGHSRHGSKYLPYTHRNS